MIDIIKKTLMAGLGATLTTKDAIESTLNELVERGKITSEEAQEYSDKMIERGRREFERKSDTMTDGFQSMLQKASFVTESQLAQVEGALSNLEALQKRTYANFDMDLRDLKQRIAELEKQIEGKSPEGNVPPPNPPA